jgi:oxygen-independent coproporphyrinogen-3 oxidase
MIDSISFELDLRKNELENEIIESIYFGGGTPSLLTEAELILLLGIISTNFKLGENIEISLEANPDDINLEKVQDWKRAGVNRLSIGIQSFDQFDLKWMNRAHTANESLEAILLAKQGGIENISIDLIYGLPEMDDERWKKQILKALELDVKHISAYCLTVEKNTLLHKEVKNGKISPANNETQSSHFSLLQEELKKAGFIQYEISNFGKENFFSKHNSSYWKGKKYLGVGPSAHSYDVKTRSWNIANNTKYIQEIQKKVLPIEREELSKKDNFNELLLIGLRTIWGVNLEKLNNLYVLQDKFHEKIQELCQNEQGKVENNYFILTEKGMHFADGIAQDLFI